MSPIFLCPRQKPRGFRGLCAYAHEELVLRLVKEAVGKLNDINARGVALWADLERHIEIIRSSLAKIAEQAPQVAKNYHDKPSAPASTRWLLTPSFRSPTTTCSRKSPFFADRADISEEITRLGGHLDQFISTCKKDRRHRPAGDGRETSTSIAQEMLCAKPTPSPVKPTTQPLRG